MPSPAPTRVWALVPVGPFAGAKSRLAEVLAPEERSELAELMLRDVLRALRASSLVSGIALFGTEPRLASLPEAADARLIPEPPGLDYRAGLEAAARDLRTAGARSLLVLPADLPLLTAEDIERLLTADAQAGREPRLTLVPAIRDGGTNGLVLTPPDALPFLFGPDSARRHCEAAEGRGLAVQQVDVPGFARDIDTPADLQWLLSQRVACATLIWLRTRRVADRLRPGG